MDLVTLALAKKYADSLKGISAEQLKPVIQAYFEEHPDEIVTNAELAEQLKGYLPTSDKAGISIIGNVLVIDAPSASE